MRCILFGLLGLVFCQIAPAANNVEYKDDTLVITILIEVTGQGGRRLTRQWKQWIESAWNNPMGTGFEFCKQPVKIVADIIYSDTIDSRNKDRHIIFAGPNKPGKDKIPGTVQGAGNRSAYDPTQHNASGWWWSPEVYDEYKADVKQRLAEQQKGTSSGNESPDDKIVGFSYEDVIVHEAGHLLGVGDEYTKSNGRVYPDPAKAPEYVWSDTNGDREMQPNEIQLRGEHRSIMAESGGQVLQRHIEDVLSRHGIECQFVAVSWLKKEYVEYQPDADPPYAIYADVEFNYSGGEWRSRIRQIGDRSWLGAMGIFQTWVLSKRVDTPTKMVAFLKQEIERAHGIVFLD